MLKVTIKFTVAMFFLLLQSCKTGSNRNEEENNNNRSDSISEARIDSAYTAINNACDTLLVHKVPEMVKLMIKKDTNAFRRIFDSSVLYNDSDKKVEKVIRQLKADCDSDLLKETYKQLHLRKNTKPILSKPT